MESDLFKKQLVGKDGYIWWIGQIAPEETWKDNIPERAVESNDEIQGFGERYRVRIFGSDPQNIQELSNEELRWAYVEYPVTAGSGSRGSSQNANIGQGTIVRGYFLDGEDGQIPIISGCIGFNEYQAISKTPNQENGFIPFSGFLEDEKQPTFIIRDSQTQGQILQQIDQIGQTINDYWSEASTGNIQALDFSTTQLWKDDKKPVPLAQPEDCEPYPTNRLQKQLQEFTQQMEALQKAQYDVRYALAGKQADIQNMMQNLTQDFCKIIASLLKSVLTQTESDVLEQINKTFKPFYFGLMPNERPELKEEQEKVENEIVCLFKKLIGSLLDSVCSMMDQMQQGGNDNSPQPAVNIPPCVVDNIVSSVVGQALNQSQGLVNSSINNITGILDSAASAGGAAGGAAGDAASQISDAIQSLTDLFSFIECEEKPDCPKTNDWSILSGAEQAMQSTAQSILSGAKNFGGAGGSSGGGGYSGNDSSGSINLDYNQIMNIAGTQCYEQTQPQVCGPPTAVFVGGGTGAQGNLVISANGNVIGYDMIEPGSGYTEATRLFIYDNCGWGVGADGYPVLDDDGGIIDIVVSDTGSGYLPQPNGSVGGDGRPITDGDDTIIDNRPIPPGNVVPIPPGGNVKPPPGTEVPVYPIDPTDPTVPPLVLPGGQTTVVTDGGTITTPYPPSGGVSGSYPSAKSYPVIMYLCEINIIETGVRYLSTDELVISPSNGAKAEFNVDELGRVISVKVTETGEGFTNMPEIFIRSQTGFNSVLQGKLCIDRVGQDAVKDPQISDKLVTVIDCVGKVNV